jgi:hypothetical protein
MTTVREICDTLGRAQLAAALGVKRSAVSNAASEGRFPAKWYLVVSAECRRHEIECPTGLFNFDQAHSPNSTHCPSSLAAPSSEAS